MTDQAPTMDCEEARGRLATAHRGRLDPPELEAHLASCAACCALAEREAATTKLLRERLDRRPAPAALRRRLAAQLAQPPPIDPKVAAGTRRLGLLLAAALAIAFLALSLTRMHRLPGADDASMVAEAVNDHLRVLVRDRPLDVESTDSHQVKPWFAGRLDFAPTLAFGGDVDFPLRGGAVGWFVDRKAATLVFERRLHVITALVFRAEGLPWTTSGVRRIGRIDVRSTTTRGFHVLLWRDGDLGYALVSDVDENQLELLAARIGG